MTKRFVRKFSTLALAAVVLFVTVGSNVGCYTQKFDVGQGATGGQKAEFQQWFVLWGLVPITEIDQEVESFTAGAEDYTITTQFTALDVIIGFFTNIVTIGPKTVTVEK